MIICIAGKNNIAVNILDYLIHNYPGHKYIACCNQNDNGIDTFQRSFRKYCILTGIEIFLISEIYHFEKLLFLSLEFDKLINPSKFRNASLYNLHFSLLPAYKGMYTSVMPILHNEAYSGVTLHKIDKGIDTGDIIAQQRFEIGDINAQILYEKYIHYGTIVIKENILLLIKNDFKSSIQPFQKSSYYSKNSIDFSNILIDLNKTAEQIHNQIRAFSFQAYQLPSVYGEEIYKSEVFLEKPSGKAGSIFYENDFYLIVNCIDYQVCLFKCRKADLFEIFKCGDLKLLVNFLDNGYDISQRTNEGWDALIISAYNGHLEFVQYLINELNWDVNTTNNNGTTFIMYAMTYCSMQNDCRLLAYALSIDSINLQRKDNTGKTVFEYATMYDNKEVLDLLRVKQ